MPVNQVKPARQRKFRTAIAEDDELMREGISCVVSVKRNSRFAVLPQTIAHRKNPSSTTTIPMRFEKPPVNGLDAGHDNAVVPG